MVKLLEPGVYRWTQDGRHYQAVVAGDNAITRTRVNGKWLTCGKPCKNIEVACTKHKPRVRDFGKVPDEQN